MKGLAASLVGAIALVGGEAIALASESPPPSASLEQVRPDSNPNRRKPKAIIDVDRDGVNEVFAMGVGEGGVLYRQPDWSAHRISEATNGEEAQPADVDGDGDPDLVIGGLDLQLYWLENPSSRATSPFQSIWNRHDIGGVDSHDVFLDDLDSDGRLDVVASCGVFIQGDGDSWRSVKGDVARNGHGTAIADVDSDGFADIVGVRGARIVWWRNPLGKDTSITRGWVRHDLAPGWKQAAIAAGDLDGDGRSDLVIAPAYADGGLHWLERPRDKGKWRRHTIDASATHVHSGSLSLADFDADGALDVMIAEQEQSSSGRVMVYRNQGGARGWKPVVVSENGGHNPKVGILDGDRYPDILNANHGFYGAPNPLQAFMNPVFAKRPLDVADHAAHRAQAASDVPAGCASAASTSGNKMAAAAGAGAVLALSGVAGALVYRTRRTARAAGRLSSG